MHSRQFQCFRVVCNLVRKFLVPICSNIVKQRQAIKGEFDISSFHLSEARIPKNSFSFSFSNLLCRTAIFLWHVEWQGHVLSDHTEGFPLDPGDIHPSALTWVWSWQSHLISSMCCCYTKGHGLVMVVVFKPRLLFYALGAVHALQLNKTRSVRVPLLVSASLRVRDWIFDAHTQHCS
jgi:hypothetical protein